MSTSTEGMRHLLSVGDLEEKDVERADGDRLPASLLDEATKARRERRPSGLDADEGEPLKVVVPLDQLVRQPRHGARERVRIEDLARAFARCCSVLHRCSFPASLDRL